MTMRPAQSLGAGEQKFPKQKCNARLFQLEISKGFKSVAQDVMILLLLLLLLISDNSMPETD